MTTYNLPLTIEFSNASAKEAMQRLRNARPVQPSQPRALTSAELIDIACQVDDNCPF
jgi:hypothetical protein